MKPELGETKILGFDSQTTIPSAGMFDVTSHPQYAFKGERLSIPRGVAPFFVIESIRVGLNEQMVGNTPIPCEIFSSPREAKSFECIGICDGDGVARGERFDLPVAYSTMVIVLRIVNIDIYPHRFLAGLIGRIVD